tara:strand:+ start:48 stop:344 length:297 start_codon:yes stop_codon:yes gene_type:complete
MINIADESTALLSLVGGQITQKADGSIIFHDGQTPPTQAEIDAEIIRLQAEYDAQAYARNREAEYPSIQELVVALYDTDDKSAIEAKRAAVKAKYPKG